MFIYSYIEEKYCIKCKKNVGVEYSHDDDGTIKSECLNKVCEMNGNSNQCQLK